MIPPKIAVNLGGRIAILGNSFYNCGDSAIEWYGDDTTTSYGGSVISGNRILSVNLNDTQEAVAVEGAFGPIGAVLPCGISVMESAGLAITNNTINDAGGPGPLKMQYSMQLQSATSAGLDGKSERIVVMGNLCGTASGQGNGTMGTFFLGTATSQNPNPKLLKNLNQRNGLDSTVSFTKGQAWPGAEEYPYDALVFVSKGTNVDIEIQSDDTQRSDGSFYLPAGQHITISWTTKPTITVFQM